MPGARGGVLRLTVRPAGGGGKDGTQ
jgi:hypothetical protein